MGSVILWWVGDAFVEGCLDGLAVDGLEVGAWNMKMVERVPQWGGNYRKGCGVGGVSGGLFYGLGCRLTYKFELIVCCCSWGELDQGGILLDPLVDGFVVGVGFSWEVVGGED